MFMMSKCRSGVIKIELECGQVPQQECKVLLGSISGSGVSSFFERTSVVISSCGWPRTVTRSRRARQSIE